jgi:hypothetical protein
MHPSTVKWDASLLSRIAPHDLESLANMQAKYDPSHLESARSHIHLLTKSGGEVTKALLSASIASGYEARPPDSEVDLRKCGQDLARALNTRLGMEKKADVQLLEYWHKTLCPTSAQQSPSSHEPFQLLALLRDVDAGDDRSLLDLVLDASRLNGTDLPLSKKVDEDSETRLSHNPPW